MVQPAAPAKDVLYLVAVSGPAIEPIELKPCADGLTIGRHANCELLLPADAERVSRFHARFAHIQGEGWRLSDLGSRWGTFLNGVKVATGRDVPIGEGDLIRISPWTFIVSPTSRRRGMSTEDDMGQTMVRSHTMPVISGGATVKSDALGLLLETAAALHEAEDEKQLAERVMDAACRGTGLANAALLRPVDTGGRVELIACNFSPADHANRDAQTRDAAVPSGFSRSLIAAAASGHVAELSGPAGGNFDVGNSIAQMNISAALCVPLTLGGAAAAYLYLDSRGSLPRPIRAGATEFCVGLGRMASLALANLKRIDIERRQASIESELMAAATAQKWVLPGRKTCVGSITCVGESRPGRYVGGDFFDVIELGDGRLGVALGDVSGKGMAASVLMTATQGYLHAALREHADPARAVDAANRFICPRRQAGKFVTAWVGVFDMNHLTLTYTDAGHSYALLVGVDGSIRQLDAAGGLPLGIDDSSQYTWETIPLPPGGRVMIVSDGIIEQFDPTDSSPRATEATQFGVDGLKRSLSATPTDGDAVAKLFADVITHAGGPNLADDATAVLVKW